MVLPITPKNALVYLPKIIISNILSNYALFMEQMWAKSTKTPKMWSVFFFCRGKKKTGKCASGEVGRSSYVSAKKKKNYTPLLTGNLNPNSWLEKIPTDKIRLRILKFGCNWGELKA